MALPLDEVYKQARKLTLNVDHQLDELDQNVTQSTLDLVGILHQNLFSCLPWFGIIVALFLCPFGLNTRIFKFLTKFVARVMCLLSQLSTNLLQLEQMVIKMRGMAKSESAQKRDVWLQRVSSLEAEMKVQSQAFERHRKDKFANMTAREERERRAQLMEGVDVEGRSSSMQQAAASSVEEGRAMRGAVSMLDDLERSGLDMLQTLGTQRDRLKGAQRKMLDIMNTMGVSNSLLRYSLCACVLVHVLVFVCVLVQSLKQLRHTTEG
jgi:hypothetical protein